MRDLRHAFVLMRRSPGLTATVLITFALGIGTTTAVFSVVNGMLLRPLPFADSERLVRIWEEHPGATAIAGQRWLSNRTFEAWTAQSQTLEGLGAYGVAEYKVEFTGAEPVMIPVGRVSSSVFGMLGVSPALGRFFGAAEDRDGAARVVVIGEAIWRERFNASPDVLGRALAIDGQPHTIVGVARSSMEFPEHRARMWVPYVIPTVAASPQATRVLMSVGKLRPGVSPAQAEAEGTGAARSMPRPLSTELNFGKGGPVVVHVRPFAADLTAAIRPAVLVLAAAVILLLLIACANVANLLLSRGLVRERELAIRMAVGASRGRLLRQLLSESGALAVAGGGLGLLLAWALVRTLPLLAPARLPRLEDVRIDGLTLAFSVLASAVAGLAAGLAPALRASRFEVYESIRTTEGSSAGSSGRHARRLRHALLIVEAAMAVLLVVGAGLLARSFVRLINVDAGYSAANVLTARIGMARGTTAEHDRQVLERLLARVRALPAVESAGAGSMMPMAPMVAMATFTIPESVAAGKPTRVRAMSYVVTPGYAEALSLRLKEGRAFVEGDAAPGPRKLLVNEEFVRQHIGRTPVVGLHLGPLFVAEKGLDSEIVGVVGNVLKDGNDRQAEPEIYYVHGAANRAVSGLINLVVRTQQAPAAVAPDVRAMIREIDPTASIVRIDPLTTLVARSVDQPRFGLTILAAFAALALTLAAVGLYGVLSYGVSQRRREIGLRAALGADRRRLMTLVLREALGVAAAGIVVGLCAAGALTRLLQGLLFGVSPLDTPSYVAAVAILLVVAIAAGAIPAWRAATTDPAVALRQ